MLRNPGIVTFMIITINKLTINGFHSFLLFHVLGLIHVQMHLEYLASQEVCYFKWWANGSKVIYLKLLVYVYTLHDIELSARNKNPLILTKG